MTSTTNPFRAFWLWARDLLGSTSSGVPRWRSGYCELALGLPPSPEGLARLEHFLRGGDGTRTTPYRCQRAAHGLAAGGAAPIRRSAPVPIPVPLPRACERVPLPILTPTPGSGA